MIQTTAAGITHTHQLSCFLERSLSLHAAQIFIFHRYNFSTFSASPGTDSEHEGKRERIGKRWIDSSSFLLQLWPAVCHELCRKLWHIDGERRCTRGSDLSFFPNRFTIFLSHTLQWCFPSDTIQYFYTLFFYCDVLYGSSELICCTSVVLFILHLQYSLHRYSSTMRVVIEIVTFFYSHSNIFLLSCTYRMEKKHALGYSIFFMFE